MADRQQRLFNNLEENAVRIQQGQPERRPTLEELRGRSFGEAGLFGPSGKLERLGKLFSSVGIGIGGGDPGAAGREEQALVLQQNQQNAKFFQDSLNNLAKMTKAMADAGVPGPVIGRFLKTNLKEMGSVVKGKPHKEFLDRLSRSLENTTFSGKGTEGTELIEVDENGFIKGTKEQLMNPSGLPITRPGLYSRNLEILPGEKGKSPHIKVTGVESAEAKSKNPQSEVALQKALQPGRISEAALTAEAKKAAVFDLYKKVRRTPPSDKQIDSFFSAGGTVDLLAALLGVESPSEPTDTKSEAERIVEEVEKGLGR